MGNSLAVPFRDGFRIIMRTYSLFLSGHFITVQPNLELTKDIMNCGVEQGLTAPSPIGDPLLD